MSKNKKKLSKEAQKLNDKILKLSKTTKTKPKKINNSDSYQFTNLKDDKGYFIRLKNGKKLRMLSPNASIYNTSATIILKGKDVRRDSSKNDKKSKFEEFLSRAPISFDD